MDLRESWHHAAKPAQKLGRLWDSSPWWPTTSGWKTSGLWSVRSLVKNVLIIERSNLRDCVVLGVYFVIKMPWTNFGFDENNLDRSGFPPRFTFTIFPRQSHCIHKFFLCRWKQMKGNVKVFVSPAATIRYRAVISVGQSFTSRGRKHKLYDETWQI